MKYIDVQVGVGVRARVSERNRSVWEGVCVPGVCVPEQGGELTNRSRQIAAVRRYL